jgi:hypothetical protein
MLKPIIVVLLDILLTGGWISSCHRAGLEVVVTSSTRKYPDAEGPPALGISGKVAPSRSIDRAVPYGAYRKNCKPAFGKTVGRTSKLPEGLAPTVSQEPFALRTETTAMDGVAAAGARRTHHNKPPPLSPRAAAPARTYFR